MAISASNSPLLLLLLSFLFLSISVSVVFAEICTIYVRSEYASPITRCDDFGFTYTGRLELNVSQISLPNPIPDNLDFSKLGFFLCTSDAWLHVLQQLQDGDISCALDSNLVVPVLTFKQQINNINDAAKGFHVIFPMTSADQYTLVFANCLKNFGVSMRVWSAMYNLEGRNGGRRNYLSAGKTVLPRVYFLFALIYFALACLWIHTIYKNRSTVFKIHFFMLAVVIMKMLNLLYEAEDKSYIKQTGSRAPYGWDILWFCIVVVFKTITKFPLMDERMIDQNGPFGQEYWVMWRPVFVFICDVLHHGTILFMFVAPTMYLRETARTDRKSAVKLMTLTLFKHYYFLVICYICFTRVVVYALVTITSYKYFWTSVVAAELTTLAFYAFTAYKYKPEAHNPNLLIADEEEEVAAEQEMLET